MAAGKEIRTKIGSIKNTQKITKAMEMVAASKMGKAQMRMSKARPYAEKIKETAIHISGANPEYHHPYLQDHGKSNTLGLVVISSDRGLCGGLNSNLFRALLRYIDNSAGNNSAITPSDCCVAVVGTKASSLCRRLGMNVIAKVSALGDNPDPEKLVGLTSVVSKSFIEHNVGRVVIASNKFENTVSQTPWIRPLLPISLLEEDKPKADAPENASQDIPENAPARSALPWDYLYEPEAKEILNSLMSMYLRSIIFEALLENIACEMASRMVAMKNATDNAGSLIDELQLRYNKIRQAGITQEISEIVAGAAAV